MEHTSGFGTMLGDVEVEVSLTYWAGTRDRFPQDIEVVAVKLKGVDIQEYLSPHFLNIIECEASEQASEEWGNYRSSHR